MNINRIGVLTPVLHLPEIQDILEDKGEIFYLENGDENEVKPFLIENNINAIFCNPNAQSYKLDENILSGTQVKLINTCSTGLNHIDIDYCKSEEIQIYSLTKDFELLYKLPSTSELGLALLLSLLRHIPTSVQHVKDYNWNYRPFIGRMASQLTVGIVGMGRLGSFMGKYCKAIFKDVLVYDPYIKSEYTQVDSLEDLFKSCDVISLHVHVNNETKYMINKSLFGLSNKVPYIINTSRGEIVQEEDIVEGLINGNLAGYGTDVIEDEFGDISKSPIIQGMNSGLNIIVTPHTGGMTIEGQTLAYKWAVNKF